MTILSVEIKEKQLKVRNIDDKDIVQIDATVIAGALIFLGVLTVLADNPTARNVIASQLSGVLLGVYFIAPFAVSAVLGLYGQTRAAKAAMAFGFGWMVFVLIALARDMFSML